MTLLTDLISLNADYASAIDDDRLEDWPAFFTDACLYRITTAQNHARGMQGGLVYADSRQMLADRVLSLRKANIYERQAYRHIVGLPRIDSEDTQGVTRVRTSFVVLRIMRTGETEIFASGNFLDEVVRVDGKLLLQRRDVICDSQRIDTLLALPL
jgi:3-phenylpropionate/cinnamic acid dioxygenase small subunit